ncbi:MAG: cyclic nucleotide-binding domain-containing protein [Verrucomicrobia bacterium]|nr:cyclic nucleotide-binding domain-containing protein [Verrucomicrobiota bacterium]
MAAPESPPPATRLGNALQLPGSTGRTRRFAAGEILFSVGEPGDGFYLIEVGRVQISAPVGGGEPRVLAVLGPGDTVGEMAVIDDAPRSATARAEVATEAKHITRDELLQLLEKQPVLALDLIRELSRRMRALNRKYLEEVVQAERLAAVGRFASTIVHDFKNPLAIIGLAAELACSSDTSPPLRQEAQSKISQQVERMTNMLQELIDFTKPGGQGPNLRPVVFPRYMLPLIDEMRRELAEQRVQLVAGTPPNVTVEINPRRLSRLFHNLLNNAVDAMPRGGKIHLRFDASEGMMRIEVEDTGPGIASEIAGTLFTPFSTHGKSHGTGLGLSICRRIAEDHGGRMWAADPQEGRGATFCFTLPITAPTRSAPG